ncbi:hypothetical protein DYB32_010789, partial [Aphanomyces invadans]
STAFSALAKGLHGVKHAFGQASPYKEFMAKLLPEQLNDHVVIVGLPASLGDIIVPLRQFNARNTCGKAQAIVFIAPFAMSEHHYHSIGDSTAVYFVQGSPLSSFDLHRIHIDTASAIIILAGSGSKRKYIDENMVDADAITTVRYINEACSGSKPPNLIVELVKATNVKFMNAAGRARVLDLTYWAGRVYVSGMIDSLMSECYQKPNIIPAINLLMFGSPTDPEYVVVVVHVLGCRHGRGGSAQRLFQVRTPKSLHGKTFGECFRKVLALNLICIGCLHSSTDKTPPYVHTNPPADMIIYQTDYIYVIGKPCSDLPL